MERTDVDKAVAFLVYFKIRRIIFRISNLNMLIISSPSKETKVSEADITTYFWKNNLTLHVLRYDIFKG
jgi:hypothetical protein